MTDFNRETVVRDPEDYNRTRRFKEIHDARQRVAEYVANMEIEESPVGTAPVYVLERLAFLVSMYINELDPLLSQLDGSGEYGSDHFGPESNVNSLEQFAVKVGMVRRDNGQAKPAKISTSLRVFQLANREYASLGMDLELAEETGDAGFDYSDLLEEGPPGDGDPPEIDSEGEQ